MPPTFEEFVNAWYDKRKQGKRVAFCCFNPIDLQSYRLSCPADTSSASSFQRREFAEVDKDLVLKNLRSIDFVGLVELYQESLCLLQVHALGKLPEYCNCQNAQAWNKFVQVRPESHGVERHSLSDYSAETLQKVDELTAIDSLLYAEAVSLFKRNVEKVETTFGVKILCRDLKSEQSQVISDSAIVSLNQAPEAQPDAGPKCEPDD